MSPPTVPRPRAEHLTAPEPWPDTAEGDDGDLYDPRTTGTPPFPPVHRKENR